MCQQNHNQRGQVHCIPGLTFCSAVPFLPSTYFVDHENENNFSLCCYCALSHNPVGLFSLKVKKHNLLNFGKGFQETSFRYVKDQGLQLSFFFSFFNLRYYVEHVCS